jgi:iron-sulfur cluster assembly accessory protein
MLSPGILMRIEVKAGGCNGFEKIFSTTDSAEPADSVFENQVVVDPLSLELLANSVLIYSDDLSGSQFDLQVPEAVSNCGCGRSFAL